MRRSGHLCVIAAGGQPIAGLACELPRASRVLNFAREDRSGERFGGRIGTVEDHHAKIAGQSLDPPGERVGHAGAWTIRLAKIVQQLCGELGGRKRRRKLIDGSSDLVAETHMSDRRVSRPRGRRQRDRFPMKLRVEDRTGRDFVPVVIFGFHPEDRYRLHVVLGRHFLRKLRGGENFVERERRPAEEACLLTRHDRDCLGIGKLRRRLACRGWRISTRLLRRDYLRDLGARPRMPLRLIDRSRPRGRR